MKTLVTGHRGFIGARLSAALAARGDSLIGIDLVDGNDLLDCPLPDAKEIGLIYHLAAQTSVEGSWNDPLLDLENLNMTARLVWKYPQAKIVFAQSAAALEPSSPYGFSKRASGEYLKQFHKDRVICVFPNVYGGGKGVVDLFKGKDEVTIYGDGLQVRDFVHVDDIVAGLLKAAAWPAGEYSMGSGKGTRVIDLAKGKKVITAPARKEIRESILSNTTPDWKPAVDVIGYLSSAK